nr:PREDICTED: cell adhesion molecule 2-like [Bemisia tabaci]XP_018897728.1 PREDICTED: cell adhesion molecule 2-like [Bemisia tabaci]
MVAKSSHSRYLKDGLMLFLFPLHFILTSVFIAQGVGGLKDIRVEVPQYRVRGEDAVLKCHYDLENDSLYAVKWYKENEEFYRFVQRAHPQITSYRVEGIKIDLELSNSTQVTLRQVTLKTIGKYRCEVSAEAPSFESKQGEGRLEVIFLPRDKPHISGKRQYYQIGDEINLNCTSGKSYPASELHWYINDQKVKGPSLRSYPEIISSHGLRQTQLGLTLTVTNDLFRDGSIKFKCIATLSPSLWQAKQEGQIIQRNQLKEASLLIRGTANKVTCSTSIWLIPITLMMSLGSRPIIS